MSRKRGKYYISNDELLKEVILYRETGRASENLGSMLIMVAENFSTKGNFSGYTWRKDMVSEAILTCLKYLKNFDPEKSTNAFAYITQIYNNSFKLYIKEQNKHGSIKDLCYKGYNESILTNEASYVQKSFNYEDILKYIDKDEKENHIEAVQEICTQIHDSHIYDEDDYKK